MAHATNEVPVGSRCSSNDTAVPLALASNPARPEDGPASPGVIAMSATG